MLQCEVIGNIGNDAEIKEFSGKKYVSFNVAHSERRKDANGTTVESTTWVSVLWYGDGGGLIQYLKRGCKVFVRGRLSVKSYQDRSGNMQVAINVNASEVQLCGIRVETNSSQSGESNMATTHEETINDVPF
ncbi:single-stranded DNA-binding protein [Bacteroides pyogenes JCM 6292]|uniref:Single-stranded DNA-binding protein n=2 Tax=Bacteroides pyogenes TaxID=310300 RepID=W4PEL9_9BACE|nr:single-stranded DNA-binding protein [Bacteroides pyogenes]GAE14615.1 single-stranded DNA-binding protein [Bacteroides pyogenes JCM 6292]GAE18212.1 single-stranded DNA-binding protein [Bacteroides pyogenes DSM 20611 = JCM 6294]